MPKLNPAHLLLAAALLAALALPSALLLCAATPPTALPQKATAKGLRWQPSLDFDTDGCYNVPAIGAAGDVVQGLPHEFTGLASNCHDLSDLNNNNVYSRQRCNNGWCTTRTS
jgi:hypothetical protein